MSVTIENNAIKLKIKLDNYFDEVSVKLKEIDSSWTHVEIEQHTNSWTIEVNGEKRTLTMSSDVPIELCQNHLYIGNTEVSIHFNIILIHIIIFKINLKLRKIKIQLQDFKESLAI